jgi:Zn-dependent alcohol dehydrogenase
MKYKAAILFEIDKFPLVEDISLDNKLTPGQVLVKVLGAGLCGAQIQELRGLKNNKKFLPHPMGHEGYCEVLEVGPGVTNVKLGDTCVMHWRVGAGIESDFPRYKLSNRYISGGKITTFSEYSVVSENRLTSVKNCSRTTGILLGCGLSTAMGVVEHESDAKIGDEVLVVGCGGVGLNVISCFNTKGISTVDGLDLHEEKKNLFYSNGGRSLFTNIKDIKNKYNIIIDTVGSGELFTYLTDLISNSGKFILVGQPKSTDVYSINNPLKLFNGEGLTIKATQGGRINPPTDIPRYSKMFEGNSHPSVTHNFNLSEIEKAFETLMTNKVCGRVLINTLL